MKFLKKMRRKRTIKFLTLEAEPAKFEVEQSTNQHLLAKKIGDIPHQISYRNYADFAIIPCHVAPSDAG